MTMEIRNSSDDVTIISVKSTNIGIPRIIHQHSIATHIIMEWHPLES